MIYITKKFNSGFTALISTIVISMILLLVVTNLSFSEFYGRSNILDSEFKERSLALAEACADTATLKLANDITYNPLNEIIFIGPDNCMIQSITGTPIKTILVRTDFKNYTTRLKIKIDSTSMFISSWEEI